MFLMDTGQPPHAQTEAWPGWAFVRALISPAAATVLLKHLENEEAVRTVLPDSPPAIAARISVEQARCTPWPFKPFKGELMAGWWMPNVFLSKI
jgi:hypothetical protein